MSTRSRGDAAEEKALAMLEAEGLICLERQFRIRIGEIDIIMYDPQEAAIVFVEVRSGDSSRFPAYKESIQSEKIRKISQVASVYLDNYRGDYENVRFDAVFVEKKRVEESVHLQNVAVLT